MTAARVAFTGPYRRVVEMVGYLHTEKGTSFIYTLSCGHEVERRQTGRVAAYCEFCPTREAQR
jgi:hypothetical protein